MNIDLIKLALGYASFLRGNIMHLPIVASTTEEMAATFAALALHLSEAEARAEKAEAILAAIKAGDMVLVPREPTPEMLSAGGRKYDGPSVYMGGPSHKGKTIVQVVYEAMIEAAQKEDGK